MLSADLACHLPHSSGAVILVHGFRNLSHCRSQADGSTPLPQCLWAACLSFAPASSPRQTRWQREEEFWAATWKGQEGPWQDRAGHSRTQRPRGTGQLRGSLDAVVWCCGQLGTLCWHEVNRQEPANADPKELRPWPPLEEGQDAVGEQRGQGPWLGHQGT